MAAPVVSSGLRFARRHTSSLCCLLLLLLPPVRRVLLFFSPLLASTALCVLALISMGTRSEEQKKRDENVKMDEWAAVQPDNPCERLQEDETLADSNECGSKPAEEERDSELRKTEGSKEGNAEVRPSEEHIEARLRDQQPSQKSQNSVEERSVIADTGADEAILQRADAKQGAMEASLASLDDAAMEHSSTENNLQNQSCVRKEMLLHEQQRVVSRACNDATAGFKSSRIRLPGRVDALTFDQANLVLAQYA